jgi:hypothetical protein
LPPKLQATPFFADGRLIMNCFKKFAGGIYDEIGQHMCKDGELVDAAAMNFIQQMRSQGDQANYKYIANVSNICGMIVERLAAYMFVVSAWHSHVGFVGDYYADPDLAVMSWKDGEVFGRPRQTVITSVINVFTSTKQPPLMLDYTHLFKGINEEAILTRLWYAFLDDLKAAKVVIDKRNQNRKIVNINLDPTILEGAVSK